MLPRKVNKTNFIAEFCALFNSSSVSFFQPPPIRKYAGINSNSQNKKNTNISPAVNIPKIALIKSISIE